MLHAMPSDGILKFRLTVKGVGSLSDGISCTEAAMRDIDSDGHPDIVVADGGRRLIVYRNLTGRTNMLRSVTLPFGGHIHISYEQTTPSYDLPGRRWVMSSVETTGGYKENGAIRGKNTFEYSGGYRDRRERDFYGIESKFDGRGNYTLGITEQIIFPEINIDEIDRIQGMNITFVTTAKTDEEGFALLKAFGLPFKNANKD